MVQFCMLNEIAPYVGFVITSLTRKLFLIGMNLLVLCHKPHSLGRVLAVRKVTFELLDGAMPHDTMLLQRGCVARQIIALKAGEAFLRMIV